jgi:hypothetical protein
MTHFQVVFSRILSLLSGDSAIFNTLFPKPLCLSYQVSRRGRHIVQGIMTRVRAKVVKIKSREERPSMKEVFK